MNQLTGWYQGMRNRLEEVSSSVGSVVTSVDYRAVAYKTLNAVATSSLATDYLNLAAAPIKTAKRVYESREKWTQLAKSAYESSVQINVDLSNKLESYKQPAVLTAAVAANIGAAVLVPGLSNRYFQSYLEELQTLIPEDSTEHYKNLTEQVASRIVTELTTLSVLGRIPNLENMVKTAAANFLLQCAYEASTQDRRVELMDILAAVPKVANKTINDFIAREALEKSGRDKYANLSSSDAQYAFIVDKLIKYLNINDFVSLFKDQIGSDPLKNNPKYAFLSSITDLIPDLTRTTVTDYLSEKNQAANLSKSIIGEILPKLSPGNTQDQKVQTSLMEWITGEIQEAINEPAVNSAHLDSFNMVNTAVQGCIKNILFNLAEKASVQYPEDDPVVGILNVVMPKVSDFTKFNDKKIQKKYQKISKLIKETPNADALLLHGSLKAYEHPDFIKLFLPLAEEIQELAGLKSPRENKLEKFASDYIPQVLAKLFASNYSRWIKTAADAYGSLTVVPSSTASNSLHKHKNRDVLLKDISSVVSDGIDAGRLQVNDIVSVDTSRDINSKVEIASGFSPIDESEAAKIKLAIKAEKLTTRLVEDQLIKLLPAEAALDFAPKLTLWVKDRLKTLSEASDPRVVAMWEAIETQIVNYTAMKVAEAPVSTDQPAAKLIIDRALKLVGDFVSDNGREIHSHYEELKANGKNPGEDLNFIKRFTEICDQAVTSLTKGIDLPDVIKEKVEGFAANTAPQLLASNYRECFAPQEAIPSLIEQLKKLFRSGNQDLSKDALDTVNFIISSCDLIGSSLVPKLDELAAEKMMEFLSIPEEKNLPQLSSDRIRELKSSYLHQAVKSLLLQSAVNYLDAVKNKEGSVEGVKLSKILSKCTHALKTHLEEDASKYITAAKIADGAARQNALRKAFAPLSKDLMKLFSKKGVLEAAGIPFIVPFASELGFIWDKLEGEIVPDVLSSLFTDSSPWVVDMESNAESIKARTGNDNIPILCKELSIWIQDMIPPTLNMGREDFSVSIYESIKNLIKTSPGPERKTVEEFITNHELEAKAAISGFIFDLFNSKEGQAKFLENPTKCFNEAVLTKAFDSLTENFKRIDDQKDDFLLTLTSHLMGLAKDHFKTINAVSEEIAKDKGYKKIHNRLFKTFKPHEGSTRDYMTGFDKQGALHKKPLSENDINIINSGKLDDETKERVKQAIVAKAQIDNLTEKLFKKRKLLLSKKLTPSNEERVKFEIKELKVELKEAKTQYDEYRKEYLSQMSVKLLEMFKIKDFNELPGPPSLKSTLWDVINGNLMPEVLGSIFDSLLSSETLDNMGVITLSMLNASFDQEDEIKVRHTQIHDHIKLAKRDLSVLVTRLKNHNPSENAAVCQNIQTTITELDKLLDASEPIFYDNLRVNGWQRIHDINSEFQAKLEWITKLISDNKETLKGGEIINHFFRLPAIDDFINNDLLKSIQTAQSLLKLTIDHVEREIDYVKNETNEQRKLNEQCGGLILEVINMIPGSAVKVIFNKIVAVREMSAIELGRAIRRQVDSQSLLKILNDAAGAGIETIRGMGKAATDEVLVEAAEMKKAEDRIRLAKEMKEQMLILSRKPAYTIINTLNPLTYMLFLSKKAYESFVDLIFAKILDKPKLRKSAYVIGKWLHYVFGLLWIKALYKWLTKGDKSGPYIKAVLDFPGKVLRWPSDAYLKLHIKTMYKNIHMPIHENLLYGMADKMIDELNKKISNLPAETKRQAR